MLAAVEKPQQLVDPLLAHMQGEVTQVPDLFLGRDDLVPIGNEGGMVFGNRLERTLVNPQHPGIAEMRVAGEENRQEKPIPIVASDEA